MKKSSSPYERVDDVFTALTKWMVYIGAAILILVMLVAFVDVIIAKLLGSSRGERNSAGVLKAPRTQ